MQATGTNQSKIFVTLRNPLNHTDLYRYVIDVDNTALARDWVTALKQTLLDNKMLEKNYCFLGFPDSARNLEYLCDELNAAVETINKFNLTNTWQSAGLKPYIIEDWYTPNTVRFPDTYPIAERDSPDIKVGLGPKQKVLNQLHNYFEQLQGTVWGLSDYYRLADYNTKYAIRQLNIICHEMESVILSQRKQRVLPEWVRPSQITTFLHAARYELTKEHRSLFAKNGYDRKFGHVYMHWTQIGKTFFEVWRDENAPNINIGKDPTDITFDSGVICEAINSLKYYSGEFDIEWGRDVVYDNTKCPWHVTEQDAFFEWLDKSGLDKNDTHLSLGYLPLGHVNLQESFGTEDMFAIHKILSKYLDIYQIEVDGVKATFNYCWSDADHKQKQIEMMKAGYDFSSRR